ncbi:MAG: STT3 domain-containing protein [Candidatus Thermoplasmatota archaeon]
MRKRAQRKSKSASDKPKHVTRKTSAETSKRKSLFNIGKNWWVTVALIGVFLLVLLHNSYFNMQSGVYVNEDGEGLSKYYLSGTDPYYNMRLVEKTHETGTYPFYNENDPLLNYPLARSGGRAPLLNMMALGFSNFLTPFMGEIDAIGYSMQFIPCLFGALLVFPIYFIGKEIFNKKIGLLSALWIPLMVAIIGGSHGSIYSLFDHDSLNILLFFTTFMFLIKSIKEKDDLRSLLYGLLGGLSIAGLSMVWVEHEYIYTVIGLYAVVQIFVDLLRGEKNLRTFSSPLIMMVTGYLVSMPVLFTKHNGVPINIPLFLCLGVALFGVISYFLNRKNIPWTLSLPVVIGLGGIGFSILYYARELSQFFAPFSRLTKFTDIIRGTGGIYGKKVSLTIGEAQSFGISQTVMNFGAALFWIGLAGFFFLLYKYYKDTSKKPYLFLCVLFVVNVWLISIAGRFITDMAPVIAIFAGFMIYKIVSWLNYPKMIRNIKSAGGGLHGFRRGVKPLHLVGVLFVAMVVILNAIPAFTSAVPFEEKKDYWGEKVSHPFGLGYDQEAYWTATFQWLSEQDQDINNSVDRPAFISWWDYGFYEVATGNHPTVADNFQDGIPPASNFHTATSEKEAVSVWIVRLLEGDANDNEGVLSQSTKKVLEEYLGGNKANKITKWVKTPTSAPSYGEIIDKKYHEYLREDVDKRFLKVGAQWPEMALYHDVVSMLTNKTHGLSDEEINSLYHDLQESTGYSIRYYGVEQRDQQIFNIFAFLSDKSLVMAGAPQDDFVKTQLKLQRIFPNNPEKESEDLGWRDAEYYYNLSEEEKTYIRPVDQRQQHRSLYYDTMFYRTFLGPSPMRDQKYPLGQLPCSGMKHFYAEYLHTGARFEKHLKPVVIAKYYEGATVNGSLVYGNGSADRSLLIMVQNNLTRPDGKTLYINHGSEEISDGNFSVLTGGGDITIRVIRYPEQLSQFSSYLDEAYVGSNLYHQGLKKNLSFEFFDVFILKNITLSVSDDKAMRRQDKGIINLGNLSIPPAELKGFVYNSTKNKPLKNVTISLREITAFPTRQQQNAQYGETKNTNSDVNGTYNFTDLFPGKYEFLAKHNGYYINATSLSLHSGLKNYNFSIPKKSTIEGRVYYDDNQNGLYDEGEEISDADVTLNHNYKLTYNMGGQTGYMPKSDVVANTTTDENGMYNFTSIYPGKIGGNNLNNYSINAIAEDGRFKAEKTAVYPAENETKSTNLSMSNNLTGYIEYDNKTIETKNINIKFMPDGSVGSNTAEKTTATTDENGYYKTALKPGIYNVTVDYKEENTPVYSFTDNLIVNQSLSTMYTLDMEKHSVTVDGYTKNKNNNKAVGDVEVDFKVDYSVENNAAIGRTVSSDEDGYYSVELSPGWYNISVDQTIVENDVNVTYTYKENNVHIAESTSIDIMLARDTE